jgi:hypothetical protein
VDASKAYAGSCAFEGSLQATQKFLEPSQNCRHLTSPTPNNSSDRMSTFVQILPLQARHLRLPIQPTALDAREFLTVFVKAFFNALHFQAHKRSFRFCNVFE